MSNAPDSERYRLEGPYDPPEDAAIDISGDRLLGISEFEVMWAEEILAH